MCRRCCAERALPVSPFRLLLSSCSDDEDRRLEAETESGSFRSDVARWARLDRRGLVQVRCACGLRDNRPDTHDQAVGDGVR